MKKKLLVTMLTLAMAGSLMACGSKEGAAPASEARQRPRPKQRQRTPKQRTPRLRQKQQRMRLHPAKSTWLAWQCPPRTCRDGTRTEAI